MDQKLIDKGIWWEEGVTLIESCTRVSEGCRYCWALDLEKRFGHTAENCVTTHPERLTRFNTRKPRVFAIWNDLFHEAVPDSFIVDVWLSMGEFYGPDGNIQNERPGNTYIVLTKRPTRMATFLSSRYPRGFERKNVHCGLTICTQAEAFDKESDFIKVPGNKFLCLEPLLTDIPFLMLKNISAVIVGTETGPHRRPAKLEWIESIIDQCDAAGVPVWVKALEINGKVSKNINDFPQKLRRRELPWLK